MTVVEEELAASRLVVVLVLAYDSAFSQLLLRDRRNNYRRDWISCVLAVIKKKVSEMKKKKKRKKKKKEKKMKGKNRNKRQIRMSSSYLERSRTTSTDPVPVLGSFVMGLL